MQLNQHGERVADARIGHAGELVQAYDQPRGRSSRAVTVLSTCVPVAAAVAAVVLSLLMHGNANAQVSSGDPCSIVRRDLETEKTRDKVSATNVSQQGARVIENAKKCLDRVRRAAGSVAMPQTRIYEATLDSITQYLMNQACRVFVSAAEGVVNEVNGTVQPYVNVLSRYESVLNGNIPVQDVLSGGGIGGAIGGTGGLGGVGTTGPSTGGLGGISGSSGLGGVVTRGAQDLLPGYTPPVRAQPVQPVPPPQTTPGGPQPRGVVDRLSCALGFGGSCP